MKSSKYSKLVLFILFLSSTLFTNLSFVMALDSDISPGIAQLPTLTDSDDASEAAAITSDALREAKNILRRVSRSTVTQAMVNNHLETMMRVEGADGALSFPTLTISGSELVEPHGDPFDDLVHIITPYTDPVVMIDIGCKYNGHCSDVTRTFFFETATSEMMDAYEAVLAAELAVIEAVAPGVLVTDLDDIVDNALSDYAGVPGISLLNIWGHGVGSYVHEPPLLYGDAEGVELVDGDVLAIEPGIYSDDGWAVRIEDTVLVTSTGYKVLSDAPKLLNDVIIKNSEPLVTGDISIEKFEYGSTCNVEIDVIDSAYRSIDSVDYFDGYNWIEMNNAIDTIYNHSYFVDYTYSSTIDCLFRVQLDNDTYYFSSSCKTGAGATSQFDLDSPIVVDYGATNPPTFWKIEKPRASMIRLKLDSFIAPTMDQVLIMDSEYRVFADWMGESGSNRWSPWIAGDTVIFHIVATESPSSGGVEDFSLTISIYEVIEGELEPPPITTELPSTTATTTAATSTNSTTTSTTSALQNFQPYLLGFGSGLACLTVIGLLLKRRGNM
ncbi:MAG: M24 family metallopeptidase, partial [Candidatus Thorarchaeota archaeon]